MAYDKALAERIRVFLGQQPALSERKMFGGIGFMLHGNMVCGVIGDRLILRVGRDRYDETLARPHTHVFDNNGRPMRGWVTVSPPGYATDDDLNDWLDQAVGFTTTLAPKA
jgi:TfoX/Sxy family transcriptional regulator of competence genes